MPGGGGHVRRDKDNNAIGIKNNLARFILVLVEHKGFGCGKF